MISKLLGARSRNERGVVLIVVALGLTAFIGVAAMALDLGMLYTARTESQRVADGAALAGAGRFISDPNAANLETLVRDEAKKFAAMNNVRGTAVSLTDADIEVWVADDSVRVTVRHTNANGNPIPTLFARVLGVDEADVVTNATAWAAPGGINVSVNCPLPISVANEWWDEGTPEFDPDEGDCFLDPNHPGCPQPFDYGYGQEDIGELFMLKPSQGGTSKGNPSDGARFEPGDWYLWLPDGSHGAASAAEYILSCPGGPDWEISVGDELTDKPGVAQGPIATAFETLISWDANAFWTNSSGSGPAGAGDYCTAGFSCIEGSDFCVDPTDSACTSPSPRVKVLPVFNAYSKEGSSDKTFIVDAFAYIFVDYVTMGPMGQWNVYARWIGGAGSSGGGQGGSTTEIIKVLRLIE